MVLCHPCPTCLSGRHNWFKCGAFLGLTAEYRRQACVWAAVCFTCLVPVCIDWWMVSTENKLRPCQNDWLPPATHNATGSFIIGSWPWFKVEPEFGHTGEKAAADIFRMSVSTQCPNWVQLGNDTVFYA